MSDYVIITDTSADIPADILDKGQIHLIPMVYQLNGEECPHRNPGNWDSRAFYDKLRAGGTGSTSQISPATYTDCFEPFLQIAAKQLHKPIHFFSGAFPVFRGKSIYCQIFHAQIFNIIADLLQIGAALNMSIATRQSLCLCPAAIAVQNNGNMIGYVHIFLLVFCFSFFVISVQIIRTISYKRAEKSSF